MLFLTELSCDAAYCVFIIGNTTPFVIFASGKVDLFNHFCYFLLTVIQLIHNK